jgi:hypothetical protein
MEYTNHRENCTASAAGHACEGFQEMLWFRRYNETAGIQDSRLETPGTCYDDLYANERISFS